MLLALDTATQTASIALCEWDARARNGSGPPAAPLRLLAEWTWLARRRQTQDLMVTVQNMLNLLEIPARDLTGLAVTTGPGSFTGVRIAASAAKGIALGLPRPPVTIGVPVLSVTAAPWLEPAAAAQAQVWAYLQAGRGRLNWCCFVGPDAWSWHPQAEDHHAGDVDALVNALSQVDGPVWLIGEATPELHAAVAARSHVTAVDAVSGARRAGHLAHLAVRHFYMEGDSSANQDGAARDFSSQNAAALQPLYLNAL